MTRAKRVAAAGGTLALSIALAGCGGGEGSSGSGTGETSAAAAQDTNEQHNDADVTFAQAMIPHHAQALSIADVALLKAESADVRALAEQIQAAQVPEIETMTTWLANWGAEVPATSRDHGAEHGGGMSGDMPGMMTDEEMAQLEGSSGAEFDRMFLEMMIRHHHGAIEMAATEQADGQNADAVSLAQEIEASQVQEVTEMQTLLQSL
jgi:uncharacterized protein (DUF305 family)